MWLLRDIFNSTRFLLTYFCFRPAGSIVGGGRDGDGVFFFLLLFTFHVCSDGTLQLCGIETVGLVICIVSSCPSASEIYISAGRSGLFKRTITSDFRGT